ncbi:uncharacterized protein BX663DRAFT_519518, partial [Cokeromyces recurvatus]|uniref:uncharacterized protein n=1 Tax=Cokeromyces recurvatus TaxID=90255 RepID=UPI0022204C31
MFLTKASSFLLLTGFVANVLGAANLYKIIYCNKPICLNKFNNLFGGEPQLYEQTFLAMEDMSNIFLEDFEAGNESGTYGSLLVGGSFSSKAREFNVNTKGNAKCPSNMNNINTVGLFVQKQLEGTVDVRGTAFVPENAKVQVKEEGYKCHRDLSSKFSLEMNVLKYQANYASRFFAIRNPTIVVGSDGGISFPSDQTWNVNDFELWVYLFSTCNNGDCNIHPGGMSDPSAILEGKSAWNGFGGTFGAQVFDIYPGSTAVFNVPVTVGSTFTLGGSGSIANGLPSCVSVLNIYPVDSQGRYTEGEITVKRETDGDLDVVVLAPQATVINGNKGGFGQQVIAKKYVGQGSGFGLKGNNGDSSTCKTFGACLPVHALREYF